jgi:hypothetical protein
VTAVTLWGCDEIITANPFATNDSFKKKKENSAA